MKKLLKITFFTTALATIGCTAPTEREEKITYFETWVQSILLDKVKGRYECEVGLTRECHEAMTQLGVHERWRDETKSFLQPPLTEAEAKEIHDYVMHFANAQRPDYAPLFTEADYEAASGIITKSVLEPRCAQTNGCIADGPECKKLTAQLIQATGAQFDRLSPSRARHKRNLGQTLPG
jgi:hypothetical protein